MPIVLPSLFSAGELLPGHVLHHRLVDEFVIALANRLAPERVGEEERHVIVAVISADEGNRFVSVYHLVGREREEVLNPVVGR